MKILILHGPRPDKHVRELKEAAERRGHKVKLAEAWTLSSSVSEGKILFWLGAKRLKLPDVCFLRGIDLGLYELASRRLSVLRHLEHAGTYVVNPVDAFVRARNKYEALLLLAKAGLKIPKTLATEVPPLAYEFVKQAKPCVYKPILGSMGMGSVKLEDEDFAYNLFRKLYEIGSAICVQELLPIKGRDLRIFVIGNRVLGAIERVAKPKEWRTNVALGADVRRVHLRPEVEEVALKAARVLGLEYAGADLAETEDGLYVLEVNASPGWQGLKRVTGIDVATELVEFVEQKVQLGQQL